MYIFVIEKLVKLCEEIRGENGAEQQEESTTVNVRLDDMTASESEGEVSDADDAEESSAYENYVFFFQAEDGIRDRFT